jgi:hypothetical protein
MIPDDVIARARAVPIASVAPKGLKRQGLKRQGLIGPCPKCGGIDRFSISTAKQVFNCRGCGAAGNVIALARLVWGTDFEVTVERLCGDVVPAGAAPARSCTAAPKDDPGNLAEAMRFWREAVHPTDTPVIPYLLGRNAHLFEEAGGEAIRFHPACKFGLHRVPCMLALVRDIRDNTPKAIHRTALDLKGNKVTIDGKDRMMLGPAGGGAVKLTPDDMVTTALGIGEGLETSLSMRLLPEFGETPVWSVLSAGGVKSFPVLAGVECLWVAVDHDQNGRGQQAARTCSARWTAAGQEVFRVTARRVGEDLNDLARRVGS